MKNLLDAVGDSSDSVIYAMDETYVRLESQNRRSWSVKGVSPILEKNNPHICTNIVGASKIHGSSKLLLIFIHQLILLLIPKSVISYLT